MPPSLPKVAVVILNYNGQHYLKRFLPNLLESTYPNLSIHIADNASTDNSIAFLTNHYPNLPLLKFEHNYGFAGGYNHALANIDADYYVLLNSDVEVTPNWIEPVIEKMESSTQIAAAQPTIRMQSQKHLFEHAGAAGGWLDTLGYPFCRGRVFFIVEEDKGQYSDTQEIFWATGAALFIRSSIYHQLGGLDEDFFAHMEEIDLCWRIKRAGYKILACPQSVVYHVGGGTLPTSHPYKTYLNFRNNLVMITLNEPSAKLWWLIPLRLTMDGMALLRFLSERKGKEALAIVKSHLAYYFTFSRTLRKRRKRNKQIKAVSIGPPNTSGRYSKSIVWQFFFKKKQHFSELVSEQ